MKIRKYVARNMPEALQQVRDDLGENAVILNTRQLRRNNRFNLTDEPRVEVTAACDEVATPPVAGPAPASGPDAGGAVAPASPLRTAPDLPASLAMQRYGALPPQRRPATATAAPVPALPAADGPPIGAEVLRQLRQLHDTVARLERRSRPAVVLPEALAQLCDRLDGAGVQRDLVQSVLQQALQELGSRSLDDAGRVAERVAHLLARQMPPCRDIRLGRQRKIVAFCGASGSGKTTAAAKIAAGFAMKHTDHIILVSTDDRRVGALDQVRAFARIIGVALEVAYTPQDMVAVLARHEDARLVLIDGTGCGPQDEVGWQRQQQLFEAAGVHEVQVVVDARSSLDHMLDQIEAAAGLGERRLLFTKMDEVARSGAVLSAAALCGLPASYLTTGAAVPGQIEAGNLGRLATRVLGVSAVPSEKGQ